MPRLTPDLNLTPEVRPVASPVDTYTGPGDNAALQLADGLKTLNPALNQFLYDRKTEDDIAQVAAGAKWKMENAATKLKVAVDQGLIPPSASPAWRRGAIHQELRVAGYSYDQALRQAYQNSPAAASDNPADFQNFVQDFTSKYAQDNVQGYDPLDVAHAFTPIAQHAQESLAQYHVAARGKAMEDNWDQNSQTEISALLDNGVANGFTTEQLGTTIKQSMDRSLANGYHDKSDFNQKIIDLVVAKAIDQRNPDILNALSHVDTVPGATLAKTAYASEKIATAGERIYRMQQDSERWAHTQDDWAYQKNERAWAEEVHAHERKDWQRTDVLQTRQDAANSAAREITAQMLLNPTKDYKEELAGVARIDPDGSVARTLNGFRQSVLDGNATQADDKDTVVSLQHQLLDAPDSFNSHKIVDAYNTGHLSLRTMQSMLDDARSMGQNAQHPFLRSPVYRTMVDGIAKTVAGDPSNFDSNKGDAMTSASIDFQRQAVSWIEANPNKSASEFLDFMGAYKDKVLKQYVDNGLLDRFNTEQPKPKPASAPKTTPTQRVVAPTTPKPNPYLQPGMHQ